ncbi:MAG: hypothetical protein KDC07_09630, partial [Chitinophagaceae bacterium]|nr:hypothetical protein [Chitinophagaceae bacterium]
LLTMFLSLVTGFIYIFPIFITAVEPVIGLALFYTVFTFFFTFTLITDFANVLIDTKDKIILFSRPVSDRTIMLSRLLYIGIYLFRMGIPMSIPAWVMFGFIKGWVGALWFPVPLMLTIFIVLFCVCGLYILMLRIAGPGKFKDILNYFQIAFSIVFFAVWMLSSRMMNTEAIEHMRIETYDWAKFLPTYWIAASWTWIEPTAHILPGTKWLSILAILFPVTSLWVTVRWLAPHFTRSLVSSDNDISPVKKSNKVAKQQGKQGLKHQLMHLLNKTETSKAGFIIAWIQTNRSRTFRMRVYPTFAYVPVYFFYILNSSKSLGDIWRELPQHNTFVILLYLSFFVISQALTYVTMSDQYKAAWIYYAAPVERPGEIILGAFKAIWVKFFLPFMLAIGLFVVVIWGPATIPDILLATINITLFSAAIIRINHRMLPFSKKEQVKDSGIKGIFRVLGTILFIGVLGLTHGAVVGIGNHAGKGKLFDLSGMLSPSMLTILSFSLKIVFLILSSIFLWLILDSIKNTSWASIKKEDADN